MYVYVCVQNSSVRRIKLLKNLKINTLSKQMKINNKQQSTPLNRGIPGTNLPNIPSILMLFVHL